MTLPLVIINPESAGGTTRVAWPRIASDLRSHFGAMLDLSAFLLKPDRVRTYKEIADFVMSKIAALGDQDRHLRSEPPAVAGG